VGIENENFTLILFDIGRNDVYTLEFISAPLSLTLTPHIMNLDEHYMICIYWIVPYVETEEGWPIREGP